MLFYHSCRHNREKKQSPSIYSNLIIAKKNNLNPTINSRFIADQIFAFSELL